MAAIVYAIGDVHGQLERLRAVHALIEADRRTHGEADATIVHLGDFVDRGPDVRGTVDYLMARRDAGAPDVYLKGNHDRMMAWWLEDEPRADPVLRSDLTWLDGPLGGRASLRSYGVDVTEYRWPDEIHAQARRLVPQAHLAFLRSLPLSHATEGVFFCHAGVRPGIALADQVEDDLVWIRSPFLEDARDHGALVVHGHTVIEAVTHFGNRVGVDTGAGYGRALSAVAVRDGRVMLLTARGRVPLEPSRPDWDGD